MEDLAGVENTVQIRLEETGPFFIRYFYRRLAKGNACRIHQNVDVSEFFEQAITKLRDGAPVGDIDGSGVNRLAAQFFNLFTNTGQRLGSAAARYDVSAMCGETEADRLS
jgi:hypothetical protein